ncbi:hypothetical protein B4U45_02070, partial [Mycobacterium persicum]
EVAHAQNAIRDLLHRLGSASGLWHEVVSVFDGDALQEVKEIAEDIKAVLHNLGREAQAKERAMQRGMGIADGLVRGMQRYVRGELTHFLGTEVGNPLATVFDFFSNVTEGVYQAAFSTVHGMDQLSPRHFLTDPEGAAAAWEGLDVTAVRSLPVYALVDPDGAAQTWKGLLHFDDWSRDRPGLGLGENVFDVGILALGVGEVRRFGAGGRAVEEGVAEEEGSGGKGVGAPGGGGRLGDITHSGEALTTELEDLGGDVPKADPKPSGEPSALPTGEPPRAPVEATQPTESTTPSTTTAESPTAPTRSVTSGPVDSRVPATPAASSPSPAPAAAGDQMPSTTSRPPETVSASVAPEATSVKPAPAVTAPASPAPQATAPRFEPPTSPTELPEPGTVLQRNSNGGVSTGAQPHPSLNRGSGTHTSGDGAGIAKGGANDPNFETGAMPGHQGSAVDEHGTPDMQSHVEDGVQVPNAPAVKVPGIDYSLPTGDALRVLEATGAELKRLADGKVPPTVLDGYDPLAGRTLVEFEREFTIDGPNGEKWWDWDAQAPNNGFAGKPLKADRFPADLRLDRLGSNAGGYLSPQGAPLGERATPPGLAAQYHVFEGTGFPVPKGKGWVVLHGPAKYAFGQPGGAEQWVVIDRNSDVVVSVEDLIDARMLKPIRQE